MKGNKPFIQKFWLANKKWLILLLKLILFAILINNLYKKFSGKEFEDTLKVFQNEFSIERLPFLLLVIALTFVNWGLETTKFYICIQRVERISFFKAYRGILFGNAMNLILPASIGELTGRPLVLKPENRAEGSGIAYYVSIVQKVASPFVGMLFLISAYLLDELKVVSIDIGVIHLNLFQLILIVSLGDFLVWFFLFSKPSIILHLLERIEFLKNIFQKIEHALTISSQIKMKLFGIGCLRFFVFVTQYWLLMFLFFQHFDYGAFYVLIGVYFLAQFVIPSMGFLDIGVRANLVMIIFAMYPYNFLQLIAVNYTIWLINVLFPSIIGFWLMRRTILE